jgi:hypothetical protein
MEILVATRSGWHKCAASDVPSADELRDWARGFDKLVYLRFRKEDLLREEDISVSRRACDLRHPDASKVLMAEWEGVLKLCQKIWSFRTAECSYLDSQVVSEGTQPDYVGLIKQQRTAIDSCLHMHDMNHAFHTMVAAMMTVAFRRLERSMEDISHLADAVQAMGEDI